MCGHGNNLTAIGLLLTHVYICTVGGAFSISQGTPEWHEIMKGPGTYRLPCLDQVNLFLSCAITRQQTGQMRVSDCPSNRLLTSLAFEL